jgi:hypothetical protein
MVTKLRLADERMKRRHDDAITEYYEFYPGDMVLLRNRASGSLEAKLIGPFTFVRFKDKDGYASILENEDGK